MIQQKTASRMRVSAEQQVHIEQLKVLARVGVSQAERSKRQRLVLNITLWPARDLRDIKDSIQRTVDYSDLCQNTRNFISEQSPKLLETLANDLASHLLRKFRIRKISLEIRKFVLKDAAYASVTVIRHASLD
jgi:FolB domain-containing protein